VKAPLKNSNYLEVASMIRAAAKNFSGKSSESPIWENSAFNLTKNIVIYCAATMGYYTLIDCYRAILKADSEEFLDELKEAKNNPKFDEEEKFNIECAIAYFIEFGELEDKFRSGVSVTATTFLVQFQDYKAAKLFCPKEEDLTIKSMDDIIDKGQVLLFNVSNESLSRSMGTFIKLHYQRSVLNRLKDPRRPRDRMAVIIADEYQDLVSIGSGGSIGDDKVCAKGREAKFCFIVASQSINSLLNAIGNDKAAKELIQNFRTRISCHSSDIETIRNFKELTGQEDKEKTSRSVSESSQRTTRNYLLGGFDAQNANINESVSTSNQKEHLVTGKEFSTLKSFEAYAQVYNGVETNFYKLYLKPYFLKNKRISHKKVLKLLRGEKPIFTLEGIKQRAQKLVFSCLIAFIPFLGIQEANAFPNVCSIVKTREFNSCLNFRYSMTTCGSWPFVRPCYRFRYMVPQTFIEVNPKAGSSNFSTLPFAATQLASAKLLPTVWGRT
jgi:hypothetical protein